MEAAISFTSTRPKKTTNPRNRRHIDILYDPEDDPNDPKRATVDIVAVHSLDGLGSNIDGTWTWRSGQPEESVYWLQDSNMLRYKIPTARIMTFNYDSIWISNAPETRVELYGEDLIRSLHNFRQNKQRPIVFVAHGFGGLVVQEVVADASACVSGDERLQLQADHDGLNKYSGPEDRSYLSVSAAIVKMCKNAATVINRQNNGDEPPSTGLWVVPFGNYEGVVGHQGFLDGHLERKPSGSMENTCHETAIEGLSGVNKAKIAFDPKS
ncbi:vegetative incompatibility protein het-e-1 [Fusarium langsethiae]|uniref:Vegetative incompatibility protein het-e-1 n=1 Tax=Fusarium langsethiae TaxID=179993 RepID=A0A0M9EUW3_FUSLA|nr:vegetative incompatibility protein het-e-1 [Fusarium langsethiae]GKU05903.1 unnamed protein product [Fusarium langsethiae]